MTEPEETLEVSSATQYAALGHPMRLRLLFVLGKRQATISQLAADLGTRKGNIAHHLGVLREAGMVKIAYTKPVRGGTEQYYERVARKIHFTGEQAIAQKALTLRVLSEEIEAAAPDPFLVLRQIHLTQAQAAQLATTLSDLVDGVEEAGEDEPRYRLLAGLFAPQPPAA
ncbi:MAG: winged helix-turn-helix transcriptional regulator [Hamadaea sp.]|uniref:ArsR/SmtB family transcription factor n=1 Tax=Hamadaea sp. TaxID=2024425 RepID=UPI0018471452|nr:helix-turn-helix domain-containing protein [Hamadaea sp.]NUR48826.1 winged helix-turn-helix transcriptional regulator [Hamadaea sp.]NUR69998.1 winged helix-turn-helix transcriptional regulator [Hamadaea sp.]NUT19706.1 winged helix-turn-helix transcriptional regulator [Hamadaea sp.]